MKKQIAFLPFIVALVLGCSLLDRAREEVEKGSDQRKQVNVPNGLENSQMDFQIYGENNAFAVLPGNGPIFFGADETPLTREEFGAKLEPFSARLPAAAPKILYIAANAENNYGSLVEIFSLAGEKKFERFKLVVKNAEKAVPEHVLEVKLPEAFEEQYFPAMTGGKREGKSAIIKPNPFTLLVEVKADGKLRLNMEEQTLETLSTRLADVFRQREANGVLREGTNEVEKTVFLKGARSAKYGEIARVIDALAKSGAAPLVVLTNDLND